MKVLHVLNTSSFSGAENVVCQIISLFRNDPSFEMFYCSPDGQIRDALNKKGIRFIPVNNLSITELRRVIKELNPDLIHAHDMRASFKVALACKKTPFVSHIHNNNVDSRGLSPKTLAYYLAAKKAKHIFWVSKNAYDGFLFHSCFKNKSSVLYNVIDLDSLHEKINEDTNSYSYDVIYLGRLTQLKNPYRLLNIFKLLSVKKSDIKIAVVGSGEMENEIKKKAREMNLLNNVFFLGFKPNPAKILHDSKIMIMASLSEGIPMCVLEAMGLGVPVVSTPVGGLTELIIDGINGYLSDSDEIIANRIIEILSNNDLLSYLSRNQIASALKWNDKEKYCDNLKETYCDFNPDVQ